jgi:hypothetical protein
VIGQEMGVWNSLKEGIRNVWEYKLLALILFLFKLFFAFLLLVPAYYMFSETFSFSPLSINFLKGYDFYLLVDFFSQWSKGLSIYKVYFLIIGLAAIFSYIFFSGGLWGALYQSLKRGIFRLRGEKFFADGGRYFGSFLKIFISVCIAYVLVLILALFIFSFIHALTGKELSYTARILILFLEILIMAILFMGVNMWSVYLRTYIVFLEERKLLPALKSSLYFILKNFGKTVLLYYLLCVILVVTLLFYIGLNKTLHLLLEEKFLILLLFILQQGFSIFRSFFRLVSYSSQMVLFDKLHNLR